MYKTNKKNLIIQSYYSKNFDNYRKLQPHNGVLPHRIYCADFWEETIPRILEFLKKQGLKPQHKIVDLGCGAFRSGLALIPYLESNNYYGVDINEYLLEDGYKYEIEKNNLSSKFPLNNIKVTHDYNMEDFKIKFDYIWSFSLWTHLDLSECDKCLLEVSKVLRKGGVYLTTCFIVEERKYKKNNKVVSDVIITTSYDKDPYHHTMSHFVEISKKYNFSVENLGIGECCPRKHHIVKFTKK